MAYISQAVVFVLAVIGVLYKSVETDEDGKTIRTPRGIPVLTRPGQIVIFLLIISFAVSIWTTRQKSKSDDDQRKRAETAEATLTRKLNDVTQQNEALKAEVERSSATQSQKLEETTQKLLEEKVQEITADITYSFDGAVIKKAGTDPPDILSRGAKLEIVGISPNESLKLPVGWAQSFLLERHEVYLAFSQFRSDTKRYQSTAGHSIKQIRTFTTSNRELGEFEKLARWKDAILEARIIVDPLDDWLNSLVKMDEFEQFDRYYNVTKVARQGWANNQTSIYPIPVMATLELTINNHKIQTTRKWNGWLAKVIEGSNDVRNLCIVKFPLVRVKLQ